MRDVARDAQASDELRRRLKWFLLGRLAVISCFFAIVAISSLSSGRERYDVSIGAGTGLADSSQASS